jgi:acyl carrier protein
MTDEQAIQATVKEFILKEFLPGEDPAALTDTTALVTTGILDSIAVLKAVTFLENQFGITIEPHEAVVERPQYVIGHGPSHNDEKCRHQSIVRRNQRSFPPLFFVIYAARFQLAILIGSRTLENCATQEV